MTATTADYTRIGDTLLAELGPRWRELAELRERMGRIEDDGPEWEALRQRIHRLANLAQSRESNLWLTIARLRLLEPGTAELLHQRAVGIKRRAERSEDTP